MTPEESAQTLSEYQRHHRIAWRFLGPVMQEALGADDIAVPMVELTLVGK